MSKVICEICGTVYPDNATACPICGYPRNVDESIELLEEEVPQSAVRRSEPVKGGRFSNKNVKKRKKEAESYEPEAPSKARRSAQEDAPVSGKKKSKKKKKNSNRGLVITVILLLIAVLLVGAYIGMRFFVGKDAYRETTVPAETPETIVVPTETEPVDTTVLCTDIVIGDINLEQGIEFMGMGRAWRVNVTPMPENTTDSLTYASSDESVAVVNISDDRVEILSVGPGSATITITCGAVTKTFPVVCSFEAETEPTEESTEPTEDTREEGVLDLDVEDISFFAVDENYTIDPGLGIEAADVEWSSDDEDVATVDENGKVTAVGEGTCEITAKYDGEEVVCIVRCTFSTEETEETDETEETEETEETTEPTEAVEDAGPPYTISHTDVSIRIGESFKLTLRDKNGDIVNVTWIGDEDVEIDGNTITGAGTGRVNVKCTHNGKEYKCIVRVG